MSSLIAKATKRGLSASQKIRATKGKKAPARKPKRPGRITAAPKAKKSSIAKKLGPAKKLAPARKGKQAPAVRKLSSSAIKRAAPKKKRLAVAPAAKSKRAITKKTSIKKPLAKLAPVKKLTAAKKLTVKKLAPKPQSRKALLARRRALVPKPLPAPPKKPPSPGAVAAVRAFEQALKVFNRQDFSTAKSAFVNLISKFADQAEIVARVRTYLAICEQRLARSPATPRNPDALYNQGVFELNKGNTAEAIELFEKALKAEPRADHVYYSLAAGYARLDDVAKAIDALRRAIGIRPVHRSHARRDLDFVGLRSNEDFQQLTGFGFDLIDE